MRRKKMVLAKTTTFPETFDNCPLCGETTSVVKLGGEPSTEICPTFCEWEGNTLE